MYRPINVSTDVFAAIWANRRDSEDSEDAILRRLLGCAKVEADSPQSGPIHSGGGVVDSRNGVHFPEGFEIFRTYKRREYRAKAQGGAWVRSDTGERYPTLNQLNASIASGAENVWNGNWKYKEVDGSFKSIDVLRHK